MRYSGNGFAVEILQRSVGRERKKPGTNSWSKRATLKREGYGCGIAERNNTKYCTYER